MVACPCCVSEDDIAALFSTPLSQLPAKNFSHYGWKAMTTWGEENEWKHFLPRLLELSLEADGPGGLGIEWVGNKFSTVDWRAWPSQEVESLRDFWRELISLVAKRGDWEFVDEWLQELARLGENGDAGLQKWLRNAESPEIIALDNWAREWDHLDSMLALWMRRPEIEIQWLECL